MDFPRLSLLETKTGAVSPATIGYRLPAPETIVPLDQRPVYFRFTMSFRDVEDLLAERGIDVSYETVRLSGVQTKLHSGAS